MEIVINTTRLAKKIEIEGKRNMQLTLTCDCGNTQTIGINRRKMAGFCSNGDTIFCEDFEEVGNKFSHNQSHPDEITLTCNACNNEIDLSI